MFHDDKEIVTPEIERAALAAAWNCDDATTEGFRAWALYQYIHDKRLEQERSAK